MRLCVLAGLLLALPAVFAYEVKYVSIGHALTLDCSRNPGGDVAWHFKQPDGSDWLLVAKLHPGAFIKGTGFQGRLRSFYQEKPGNYSLVLNPVVYNDLGIYECRDERTVLSDVKLNILVPSVVSVALGMPASLPCYASISKRARTFDLNLLWSRNGMPVYQLQNNISTSGPEFENRSAPSIEQALMGNMSLAIYQTRFSDQGDYQCQYDRSKTSGNPDSAELIVTAHRPLNLTLEAGDTLSLPLHTTDPVRVTFTPPGRGEVLMASVNRGLASYGGSYSQRCELLAPQKTLRLRTVDLEDAGLYKVADAETNQTISTVSVQVPGPALAMGKVAGVALGVGALVALVVAVGFAVRWRLKKGPKSDQGIVARYEAARAVDQNGFNSRVEGVALLTESAGPGLLVPKSGSPEPGLPVPESGSPESGSPEPGLPVPESGSPEPGLPVPETEPSPQTQVQEKKSEGVILLETP